LPFKKIICINDVPFYIIILEGNVFL